jgi:hypothetical protein
LTIVLARSLRAAIATFACTAGLLIFIVSRRPLATPLVALAGARLTTRIAQRGAQLVQLAAEAVDLPFDLLNTIAAHLTAALRRAFAAAILFVAGLPALVLLIIPFSTALTRPAALLIAAGEGFIARFQLAANGSLATGCAADVELYLLARFHAANARDELLHRAHFAAIHARDSIALANAHFLGGAAGMNAGNNDAVAAIALKGNAKAGLLIAALRLITIATVLQGVAAVLVAIRLRPLAIAAGLLTLPVPLVLLIRLLPALLLLLPLSSLLALLLAAGLLIVLRSRLRGILLVLILLRLVLVAGALIT